MNVHEIVKKLIGEIKPVGDTNTDAARFANLTTMTNLVENLLMDIGDICHDYKDMPEYSIKKAVEHANKFMAEIKSQFK